MASVANGVANGHHPSSSQVQPRKPWSVRFQNLAKAFNDNIVKEVKKDIADLTMSDGKDYLWGGDNVFLLVEDEYHKMDIAGLYIFEDELDPAKVIDQLSGYLDALTAKGDDPSFYRMKSRINLNKNSRFGRPFFERCTDFNIENHFEKHSVLEEISGENTPDASERAVGLMCGRLLAEGNDWNLPPWKMYLLTDVLVKDGKKGAAIFWKLHHALADGEGSIRPFISYLASIDPVTGKPREGPVDVSKFQYNVTGKRVVPGMESGRASPALSDNGDAKPAPSPAPSHKAVAEATAAAATKTKSSKGASSSSTSISSILEDPRLQALYQAVLFWIYGIGIFLLNLLSLAMTGFRKSYWSKRGFFTKKQLGFSKPLPMKEVKRVKNALGVTVNDLMVTCTHSAVLKYAKERDALKDKSITYLVPTSLRNRADNSMTNQSSGWLLPLPTEQDPSKLLGVVRGRMNMFKKSVEPIAYFYGQRLTGRYPWLPPKPSPASEWGRKFWKLYGVVLSAITNVPGPSTELTWAGVPYKRYVPVIPTASHNGLGLAIASYAEGIALGINMDLDEEAVAGSELFAKEDGFVIARYFEEAFKELVGKADEAEKVKAGNKLVVEEVK